MGLMPHMMLLRSAPCYGAPVFVGGVTASWNDAACPTGGTYQVAFTLSGTTSGWRIDVWRKTSSGGSFSYYTNFAASASSPQTLETPGQTSTDNGNTPATWYREYQLRIVPDNWDAGSHDGCDVEDSNSDSRTLYPCVE